MIAVFVLFVWPREKPDFVFWRSSEGISLTVLTKLISYLHQIDIDPQRIEYLFSPGIPSNNGFHGVSSFFLVQASPYQIVFL